MTPDRSDILARIKALPPLDQQTKRESWWTRLWLVIVWKQVQS